MINLVEVAQIILPKGINHTISVKGKSGRPGNYTEKFK